MPVVQIDPSKRLGFRQQAKIARNDSFRSERSADKRVSFNNDVGVKHIPRGQKDSGKTLVKTVEDEWSKCEPVLLEKPELSSQELERQAEDLVRLLDKVDCISAPNPIHYPSYFSLDRPKNRNKTYVSKANDNKALNNNEKKINLQNGGISVNFLTNNRTTNPIKKSKDNVNLYRNSNNLKNRRSLTPTPSSTSYEKLGNTHKSVPDLQSTVYHNETGNRPHTKHNLIENNVVESKNFMSVDNLYEKKGKNQPVPRSYKPKKNRNEYKSADNLTDISIPGTRKLKEYKPYENLQSGFSSSTDLKMNEMDDNYSRPNVGSMIKRFNSDSGEHKVITHPIYFDNNSSRGYKEPNSHLKHNKSKPFSYTSAPLSSVEEIRRFSPSRDIPVSKKDSGFPYTNKYDRRARSNSREYDPSPRNTDSDYSAKIIITGNNIHSRYDDDDHAYETYQVGEGQFAKHIRDYRMSSEEYLDDYKNHSNNNINMSSIGVQTERLSKGHQSPRRNQKSLSPARNDYNGHDYREDLPSASLVRRINHGFGRVDKSPSPPPVKRMSSNRLPKNVVPLLSDTDESEFDYHRRMDPLAKIRNQVMIREKLQEEKEAEERAEREEMFEHRHKSPLDLNSSEMQPLTVDEIDALTLEVDKKGRNTLIVAHDNSANRSSRMSKEYHKSNTHTISEHKEPIVPPRGRKTTPDRFSKENKDRFSKENRERSKSPGILSTLERIKKTAADKTKSTLEKNKGKEKKKKKIKIKFFYDPRPQDKPNEDPLDRYTEYKGNYSDDQEKQRRSDPDEPYDNYYNEKRNNTSFSTRNEYHSLTRENRRERERRYNRDSSESPSRIDSSKENRSEKERRYHRDSSESPSRVDSSHSRPPRSSSRDRPSSKFTDRDRVKASRFTRDSSSERILRKEYATDPRNNRIKAGSRSDHDSTMEKREKRNNESRNDYHKERQEYEKRTHYNNIRNETRFTKTRNDEYANDGGRDNDIKPYRKKINEYESDRHDDSSDHGGPSLSEKYRSLTKRSSPVRERTPTRIVDSSPDRSDIFERDEERKQKIERQRKKFFGVLLGEGKAKSANPLVEVSSAPPPPSETKVISSTLPRTSQPLKDPPQSSTLQRIPYDDAKASEDSPKAKGKKSKKNAPKKAKKGRRPWPWSFLMKGNSSTRGKKNQKPPRSSRASSRASSRGSSSPRRPGVRASKIRKDGLEVRAHISRDREADKREKQQWESAALTRSNLSPRQDRPATPSRGIKTHRLARESKYSAESSPSSTATPTRKVRPVGGHRYFGDTDTEAGRTNITITTGGSNYRSLPNRKPNVQQGSRINVMPRRGVGIRKPSPGARGSAGSSLQSSESEADSHGGSHASRASHVSTGSNRSVYLHATAVADIPVRRSSDEAPSEKGVSRQSKKVTRSFSLASPWKPRHYREKYEVEYDNREVREARENRETKEHRDAKDGRGEKKNALPPRPPRKVPEPADDAKQVGRSQTVNKDSKLAGWLRRKRNKDVKGI